MLRFLTYAVSALCIVSFVSSAQSAEQKKNIKDREEKVCISSAMTVVPTTAVILAAGIGKRYGIKGKSMPKGFIQLGGKPLIQYSLEALFKGGIKNVLIITGHCSEFYEALAKEWGPSVRCFKDPIYAQGLGPMRSLYAARDQINGPFLLLDSDIVYLSKAVESVCRDEHPNLIFATTTTNSGDEYYIEADENSVLSRFSADPKALTSVYAEQASIAKFSLSAYQEMCSYYEALRKEDPCVPVCYNDGILAVKENHPFFVLRKEFREYPWTEIDCAAQEERAKNFILPLINAVNNE